MSSGVCQEVVHTGDDVDLFRLPLPIYSEKDGGAYVTVALEISRDPIDGGDNASIYRMMRLDRNHLAVMSHVFQGLGTHMAHAEQLGVPLDVAIVNGVDPVLLYASQAKVPHGFFEIDIAGGINGSPVEMVRCKTIDLAVPATAEIVIEGRVLPGERAPEGPFGEFTGLLRAGRAQPGHGGHRDHPSARPDLPRGSHRRADDRQPRPQDLRLRERALREAPRGVPRGDRGRVPRLGRGPVRGRSSRSASGTRARPAT